MALYLNSDLIEFASGFCLCLGVRFFMTKNPDLLIRFVMHWITIVYSGLMESCRHEFHLIRIHSAGKYPRLTCLISKADRVSFLEGVGTHDSFQGATMY